MQENGHVASNETELFHRRKGEDAPHRNCSIELLTVGGY